MGAAAHTWCFGALVKILAYTDRKRSADLVMSNSALAVIPLENNKELLHALQVLKTIK